MRRAEREDAGDIARVFTPARRAMPGVPIIHTANEDSRFISDILVPGQTVWVGLWASQIAAMAAWHEGWLTQLYVHSQYHRRGLGQALLDVAKAQNPSGLRLWVFQSNSPARTFYEAHGFACIQLTDGQTNEEQCPDALYAWETEEGETPC